ncbi:hypothetical protein NA23_05840 [Fervidobacterium islandicum]|uniref:Uncharacterized protein n=1 Tax=Fervidobacterium islandicum TaxID=2423 RepID=A0AAI8CM94_FERIS|nr:hypothetical protein [Fervidobacterium islandicum]AMW32836.1 hypothetical protein NA23_05840 [Fervidobacterium islandicum]
MFDKYYLALFNEYLHKQFKEKFGALLIFFVLMLLPGNSWKLVGLFFGILFAILSDLKNRRLDLLLFLPYTKELVYWFGFGFLVLITVITSLVGMPFYDSLSLFLKDVLSSLIFLSAYLGLSFVFVNYLSFDPFGSLFLILLVDVVLGSIGSYSTKHLYNPYRLISPIRQESVLASAIFAAICLYIGYLSVTKKGGE